MGITLNNTGAGGSVNITLDIVVKLNFVGKTSYFKRKVPGKETPHTDTSTMVASPTGYNFAAYITTAQKATMETMKTERQHTIVYSDNELSNKSCRYEDISFDVNTGVDSGSSPSGKPYLPWVVSIRLTGLDH